MKKLIEIIGWVGIIIILGAYALVSFSILNINSLLYQSLNLVGAVGVSIVALKDKDYQSGTLNMIWALIALLAILKIIL